MKSRNLFRLAGTGGDNDFWHLFLRTGTIPKTVPTRESPLRGNPAARQETTRELFDSRPSLRQVVEEGEGHVTNFIRWLEQPDQLQLADPEDTLLRELDRWTYDHSPRLRSHLSEFINQWQHGVAQETFIRFFREDLEEAIPHLVQQGRFPTTFVAKYVHDKHIGKLIRLTETATGASPMTKAVVNRLKYDPRLYDDEPHLTQPSQTAFHMAIGGDDQTLLLADRLIRDGTVDPQGSDGDGYRWVRKVAQWERDGGNPPVRWIPFIEKMTTGGR
jgi:hypothetical protein